MEAIDYFQLYALQDTVLDAVAQAGTSFYLTGGTCLHRFHTQIRYSDDLDFFSSDNDLFRDDMLLVLGALSTQGLEFEKIVDTRDFVRLMIQGRLKADFVNDRVFRVGKSIRTDKGLLDNIENIAANKICAVLGRDEPKDVFDLITIHEMNRVNWAEILVHSRKKCAFETEELEARLTSFPLELLDALPVVSPDVLPHIRSTYPGMMAQILIAETGEHFKTEGP